YLNTQSTTTNDSGAYQFTGVTSGSYTLELDVPFGFSPNKSTGYDTSTNTNKLTFTIPPPASAADFGIVPYEVGVGGTMYTTLDDSCSTSITNQGRLGSKSLSLSENYFGLSYSTATNSNGAYSFSYPNQTLFPGSYSITPSDVSGARLICALVYADDGSATAVSVRSTPFTYGDDPGENLTLTTAQPQKRVDFYYQLVQPWIQGKGADMRIDSGFNDPVSASSRDPYAMLLNRRDGSPGVIFSGDNSYSFCVSASSGICLERSSEDPLKRWVVGGTIYPETFTPAIPGTTRTSYSYLLGLAKQKGKTITEIPDSIDGRNCYDAPGCNLAALDPDPDVVYTNQPGRDVYTRSSGITFNRGDYVFLIKGNLHIQGEIQTVSTPNASTLVVSVSGDITVDADVGGSSSSSPTHIKGLFSADSDFVLESNGTQGSNCPSDRDKRLNMQGAVVANAALDPLNPGTFQNNRTLCNDNSDYPVFYIEEQPEFILNFPDFLKHKSFVWQEVAP
ncbi:MAG: hypothetical protein HYS68_00005, partial [Candidatus Levybacteria bacterium]|nr:hypothetical protein [Candidatus Levybacteria bacterium]